MSIPRCVYTKPVLVYSDGCNNMPQTRSLGNFFLTVPRGLKSKIKVLAGSVPGVLASVMDRGTCLLVGASFLACG